MGGTRNAPTPGDAMNPLQNLNPMMPVVVPVPVPVAVPVAVPVTTPMVARRVQPQQTQQAKQPTTLETVAKVVDGVNQLVGAARKLFGGVAPAAPGRPTVARRVPQPGYPTHTAQPDFLPDDQLETLPDSAFGPPEMADGAGGDWGMPDAGIGAGGDWGTMPEPPVAPGWDMSQMLGFDPNAMMGFDPSQMMAGFDPNAMMGYVDPNSGW